MFVTIQYPPVIKRTLFVCYLIQLTLIADDGTLFVWRTISIMATQQADDKQLMCLWEIVVNVTTISHLKVISMKQLLLVAAIIWHLIVCVHSA